MKHPKSYDSTPETRKRMGKVKLKGGKAETMLAKALWHQGYRYRSGTEKIGRRERNGSNAIENTGFRRSKRTSLGNSETMRGYGMPAGCQFIFGKKMFCGLCKTVSPRSKTVQSAD